MNPDTFLQLGSNHYYPAQKLLTCANGQALVLRSQSLEVLNLLARTPNQLVSKDTIFSTIWKTVNVTDDSLVQCISEIRRQLKDSDHKILQTLPKQGYRLVPTNQLPVEQLISTEIPANRPAIAVMQFQNIGGDHTGDILAVGLATDIHFNLAKMSRLFVIAQASANRLQHLMPHEIGQQLGVSYLIHGATQRSAQQVRATISLVETNSGRVLWSEQYERPLGSFLLIQDEITLDVVSELDHRIEQYEIKKAFSAQPDNLGAWELYHQGLWYITQTNQSGINKASQLLKQSLALDPSFAPVYAALSSTSIIQIYLCTELNASEHANQALDYAYQCLELDNQSGWGYWSLGRALHAKRQHKQALEALDLSIKYKPNFSWNHYTKAIVGCHSAGSADMLPAANQALRLSPFDPFKFSFLCAKTLSLIKLEDYEEAAIWGLQAARDPKAYHLTYAIAALTLQLAGQSKAAKAHIDQTYALMPEFSIQNYRNSLPHDDETAPDRLLVMNTLKKLGVPETNNA